MSLPLNPNAESFLPKSSSSSSSLIPPFIIQISNAITVPPLSSLLPPSVFHPTVLPPFPHPHHLLLQVSPCFYNQYPPPSRGQEICYGFPPPPPPPTKLISDYAHQGRLMIMATLDLYKDSSNKIGTGCFLKTSTGRNRRCSKKLQLPPPSHHRRQIRSSSCCTSKKQLWQPKSGAVVNGGGFGVGGGGAALASTANVVDVPKPPQFSSGQVEQFGSKTSVMIKNIPNRYCREKLMELLVDHCKKENGKEEGLNESAFDFVYLPIDFETECNKGYAFVNFTNPNGGWRLFNFLNNRKWDEFNSRKICEVTYARIQGKVALVKRFNRSTFACEKDEYLPVYFNPYLNGSVQDESVEVITVGTRTTRLLSSSSSQHLSILRRGENEKDGEEGQP